MRRATSANVTLANTLIDAVLRIVCSDFGFRTADFLLQNLSPGVPKTPLPGFVPSPNLSQKSEPVFSSIYSKE